MAKNYNQNKRSRMGGNRLIQLGFFSQWKSHLFCSHALTIHLYPFIHRSFGYGSKSGGKYESKRLLSYRYIVFWIIFLMLSSDF